MKVYVKLKPAAVTKSGEEIDLSTQVFVEKNDLQIFLTPDDFISQGRAAKNDGEMWEVVTVAEHIMGLVNRVNAGGTLEQSAALYREIGLSLRSVTSEHYANILVDALMNGRKEDL